MGIWKSWREEREVRKLIKTQSQTKKKKLTFKNCKKNRLNKIEYFSAISRYLKKQRMTPITKFRHQKESINVKWLGSKRIRSLYWVLSVTVIKEQEKRF